MPDNSVDSVVTDPPYGWRFMGKAWDGADIEKMAKQGKRPGDTFLGSDGSTRKCREYSAEAAGKYDLSPSANQSFQSWTEMWAREAFRVLKPGGHMLVFCGPRTYHRMASGVEDAGFEIRDQLQWLFGSGFPKSFNLGDGVGSALKPANEPIVLARKPLSERTLKLNHEKWGCGGLNIDASRIEHKSDDPQVNLRKGKTLNAKGENAIYSDGVGKFTGDYFNSQGRFPSNLLLSETAAEMLDEQSGVLPSRGNVNPTTLGGGMYGHGTFKGVGFNDHAKGQGASRFFYCAKASKSERNAGLEGMPKVTCQSGMGGAMPVDDDGNERDRFKTVQANHHPTVKPIKLMEYLIRLVTPPQGVVLDPFMGSGTTGVAAKNLGFEFIGIEMNEEYVAIAEKRIANE